MKPVSIAEQRAGQKETKRDLQAPEAGAMETLVVVDSIKCSLARIKKKDYTPENLYGGTMNQMQIRIVKGVIILYIMYHVR